MSTRKQTKYDINRFDKDCYQILEGQKVVGFVIAMTNGAWSVADTNDKRLDSRFFVKPRKAFEHWVENYAPKP